MKPTQQEIIELAREVGVDAWWDSGNEQRKELDDLLGRLVHLALERFGAGGGEPVAYMCPTSRAMADGSMEAGPDYLEWADEASDYEKRVGTPLYTHPSPTDLRVEYLRGLEDAAKMAEAFHRHGYDYTGNLELHEFIRALKGKK